MKHLIHILFWAGAITFFACQGGTGERSEAGEPGTGTSSSGDIVLSLEQFNEAGMVVGDPSKELFSNEVRANGIVVAAIGGSSEINTLVAGRIRKINHAEGEKVRKGDVLFSIESNEFIVLQQEYADTHYQLILLEADFDRQKALYEEKILAQKEFLRTESEYRRMMARKEALEARLHMIQVDPEKVKGGTIEPYLSIRSPLSGIITHQEMVLGQFVEPMTTVMEVVDSRKLQLSIRVFEQNLEGVEPGQQVHFNKPDQPDTIYKAVLSHVGRSIDPETKSVHCIGRLDPEIGKKLINNLFVETKIITCEREALAIPESAVIKEDDHDFLWILVDDSGGELVFRKIPVRTGVTRGGYTEVLEDNLSSVLLQGANSLWQEE